MIKAWKHFCTITKHKNLVLVGCFKVGLYRQGLLHDLSKYFPTEFLVGCKYYKGYMSPNNAEREDKGYSSAWLHHKGRNKHHMEYWIDYAAEKDQGKEHGGLTGAISINLCNADAEIINWEKYTKKRLYFQ